MVDAVVAVALDRLLQVLTSQGLQFIKFDREFEEVRTELLYINSFLKDAEKVKQVNQMEMLRTIMQDLREMVYDVEDIMEDFELHRLKCRGGYKLHCMGFSSLSSMKFYFEIGKRLRMVRERMTKARGRMTPYLGTALALPSQWPEWGRQPLRNPILVDEAGTVGLAEDQWKIGECLLEASGHLTVIGIVGMGGIGKTTLAQQIYNDRSLKEQYGYIIFLTVSQSFELKELIRTMLRKLNESEDSMRGDTADLLRTLHSKLDKKYLIILDDVWGADEGLWWESLKSGFPHRAGSCVIVTTRDEEVARSMGATHRCIHHLRLLSEENGWSLFSKVVFERDGGQCPNMDLEVIGKEIVSQCRGLPLAIKIAGGMMVGKEKSAHRWSQISKHLKQELATHNKDKAIFSTLSLSYEELPTHLKPCFLSFAMFPEDTEILVHIMMHWWIGEGFIRERDGKTAYEIGEECINELFCRCLLLGSSKTIFETNFFNCRLHDMVRDMVIKIAREENFMCLDDKGQPSLCVQSRRGGILRSINLESFEVNSKSLRTLVGMHIEPSVLKTMGQNMSQLKRLRVLDLLLSATSDADLIDENVLSRIGLLQHLICLKIENCRMKKLPNSITNLRKLRILRLYNWPNLRRLPPSVTTLEQLNIMQIFGCDSLECMPKGFSNLHNLQILWGFTPGSWRHKDGCRVAELRHLNQLKTLFIEIKSEDQIVEGELNVLSQLQDLKIKASNGSSGLAGKINGWFSSLQQLEKLRLHGLQGVTTPTWLNPTSLPNLRHLSIVFPERLVHLNPIFWDTQNVKWKLEVFVLMYLDELDEEWPMIKGAMPFLKHMKVQVCPKLKLFPFDVTPRGAMEERMKLERSSLKSFIL